MRERVHTELKRPYQSGGWNQARNLQQHPLGIRLRITTNKVLRFQELTYLRESLTMRLVI